MLTAYCDESGIHDAARCVIWGGYMAPQETWISFSQQWEARLQESGLKFYHMAPAIAGDPPFCPPLLNRAAEESLRCDLSKIIRDHDLHGIAIILDKHVWAMLIESSDFHKAMFGGAVERGFFECSQTLWQYSIDKFNGDIIGLVYGDGHLPPRLASFIQVYDSMRENYPESFAGVTFQPMKLTPGIQAADMLLWEIQDSMKRADKAKANVPMSPAMKRLIEKGLVIRMVYEPQIAELRASCSLFEDGVQTA